MIARSLWKTVLSSFVPLLLSFLCVICLTVLEVIKSANLPWCKNSGNMCFLKLLAWECNCQYILHCIQMNTHIFYSSKQLMEGWSYGSRKPKVSEYRREQYWENIVWNLLWICLAWSFPGDWECKSCTEKTGRDDVNYRKKDGCLIVDGHI